MAQRRGRSITTQEPADARFYFADLGMQGASLALDSIFIATFAALPTRKLQAARWIIRSGMVETKQFAAAQSRIEGSGPDPFVVSVEGPRTELEQLRKAWGRRPHVLALGSSLAGPSNPSELTLRAALMNRCLYSDAGDTLFDDTAETLESMGVGTTAVDAGMMDLAWNLGEEQFWKHLASL